MHMCLMCLNTCVCLCVVFAYVCVCVCVRGLVRPVWCAACARCRPVLSLHSRVPPHPLPRVHPCSPHWAAPSPHLSSASPSPSPVSSRAPRCPRSPATTPTRSALARPARPPVLSPTPGARRRPRAARTWPPSRSTTVAVGNGSPASGTTPHWATSMTPMRGWRCLGLTALQVSRWKKGEKWYKPVHCHITLSTLECLGHVQTVSQNPIYVYIRVFYFPPFWFVSKIPAQCYVVATNVDNEKIRMATRTHRSDLITCNV